MASRSRAMVALAAVLCGPGPARATALKVYPVRLTLSDKQPISAMTIRNVGAAPGQFQLRVFAWVQRDNQDVLTPTRDVLVNPGVFAVAADAEQIARFGLRSKPTADEQNYRVIIQELPNSSPLTPGQVSTVLRVSVPIFVALPGAKAHVTWRVAMADRNKVVVDMHNDGTAHVQLVKLRLAHADGQPIAEQALSAYVLAGSSRRLILEARSPIQEGETISISALTDGDPISTTVIGASDGDAPAPPH